MLVGAEVPGFGSRSTLVQGDRYLVAETCEYRRHFLNFRPRRIVITSIEPDHLDYFRGLPDMLGAFEEYGLNLAHGGMLIFCADDDGARVAAGRIKAQRQDLVLIAYGRTADGAFRIAREEQGSGRTRFWLAGISGNFELRVPGGHNVLNAAAALALCLQLWPTEWHGPGARLAGRHARPGLICGKQETERDRGGGGRRSFHGRLRASPDGNRKDTLGNPRLLSRRGASWWTSCPTLTPARTPCLASSGCFGHAHSVVLHKIYACARETNEGGVTGETCTAKWPETILTSDISRTRRTPCPPCGGTEAGRSFYHDGRGGQLEARA